MIDLILGDCQDIHKKLLKVDALISDPPYGMNWNNNCSRFSGGTESIRKKRGINGGHNWVKSIDDDDKPFDPRPWLGFPKVILWGSNHFGSRLPVGTTLVWVKRNESAYGSFLSDAEIGWMKSGHGVYLYKDLSMKSIQGKQMHPNQKPVGLMRWCIQRLRLKPGSTILDPYMGYGSTGVAAVELGFNFIGIEKDPVFFTSAKWRIHHTVPLSALI